MKTEIWYKYMFVLFLKLKKMNWTNIKYNIVIYWISI